MRRGAKASDDSEDRGTLLDTIVEDGEGKLEPVGFLPDGQDLGAGLAEQAPSPLREYLAADPRERLRRAEAVRRAADEEDAGRR
jgi:hypothetical protein